MKLSTRRVLLGLVTVVGWWMLASLRTTEYGTSLRMGVLLFLFAIIVITPIARLAAHSTPRPWRTAFLIAVGSYVLCLAWATAEEYLVTRNAPKVEEPITRWAPFSNHTISYSSDEGRWKGED